jgi:membrane-associated phospholipid phosphatase
LRPIVTMSRPGDVNGYFGRQLDHVMTAARHRDSREAEIVSQLLPQTPYWAAVANLQPNRHRATFELLELALAFASSIAMRFKHALALPRPAQFSPKVQAMVPTPEHSTLPSGHATEAYMAAHVLRALMTSARKSSIEVAAVFGQLEALAARIANNRMVAGVHFPADSMAGRLLGATIAEFCLPCHRRRCSRRRRRAGLV